MPDPIEVEATDQIQFNKSDYVNHDNEVKQAGSHGWKDWDEHIENKGDPEKWVSAEVFNERGRSIKSSIKQKSNHNKEQNEAVTKALKDVNEVHKVQMDIRLADLVSQRKTAIEDGEADKVTQLDSSIDQTKDGIQKLEAADKTIAAVPNNDIMHEQQWSQDNAWFNEMSPKGSYARELAQSALNKGYHGEDLTSYIEKEVADAFPDKNENRNKAGMSDKGGKRSSNSNEALTMSSLNGEEARIAQSLINSGKSEKDVLSMVKNSRV